MVMGISHNSDKHIAPPLYREIVPYDVNHAYPYHHDCYRSKEK
jgi:tRNA A37 threonylcarbamoyladenosine biosynthesis protein TsaE